ncbi:hypothetical protein Celaphus_00015301 [Cervus elaphus hippelaphus]|uniref:Uncharacterized protein n=1 Tax=Cervus elaphus hippelaphus TaxID=46360 RepID=A0A212CRW8_CEREH|nr:hypothetical protein Celaphus_00015301 [Cervus elaphus hippelaphus]
MVLEVSRGQPKSARQALFKEETLQKCVMEFPVYIFFMFSSLLKAIQKVVKLFQVSDNHENKELKQRLNFSYCEEEHENKGQKEIQERKEAPSQTPEKSGGIEKVSPDQGLMTPVPHSLTCTETPAPPDEGKPPLCENLFTPKGQHLKLTPGPFTGEMTSLALVSINPFTLES